MNLGESTPLIITVIGELYSKFGGKKMVKIDSTGIMLVVVKLKISIVFEPN